MDLRGPDGAPAAHTAPERAAPRALARDFTFTQYYHAPDYPYEEKGFFRLGKGRVLLLTTPVLSTLPPRGKNEFICDLVKRTARLTGQPVTISPPSDPVEFLMGRAVNGRVNLFLMNHERERCEGDVIVDLAMSGLSPGPLPSVSATVYRGYEAKDSGAAFTVSDGRLTIRNLALPGAAGDFDPCRAASYAVITVESKSAMIP